jgi:hypothetical protein
LIRVVFYNKGVAASLRIDDEVSCRVQHQRLGFSDERGHNRVPRRDLLCRSGISRTASRNLVGYVGPLFFTQEVYQFNTLAETGNFLCGHIVQHRALPPCANDSQPLINAACKERR